MTGAEKLKAFATSPWHAWSALLTLGPGVASLDPFYAVLGVAAYLGAWVFLPDSGPFRRWIERREAASRAVEEQAEALEWDRRQKALFEPLTPARKAEFLEISRISDDIERLVAELVAEGRGMDAGQSVQQVNSLVWTFLRLLKVEQDQHTHLSTEYQDDVPAELVNAEEELKRLEEFVPRLESGAADKSASARIRIAESQRERIKVLRQRLDKLRLAEAECELVRVEKARILDLFKLLRADLQGSRDLHAFSGRIDDSRRAWAQSQETAQHLDFLRDASADAPPPSARRMRVRAGPPPIPGAQAQ